MQLRDTVTAYNDSVTHIVTLWADIAVTDLQLGNLSLSLAQALDRVTTLEDLLSTNISELASLAAVTVQMVDIGSLQTDVHSCLSRVTTYEDDVDVLSSNVTILTDQLHQMGAFVDIIQRDNITTLFNTITTLFNTINEIQSNIISYR